MDQVDEVKNKIDLVEVVSSYFPLKKAGRNFTALCPFHGEKTPSFMVSPDRQVFKCFGCGESGDVFTFLEKMESWDFKETLEELAKRAGVKLTSFQPTERSQVKDKLVAVNNLAGKFYDHVLNKHPRGEAGRRYLEKRGIKKSTWEKFGIGFSPAGWENTLTFLKKRGFSIEDIATSGLVVASEKERGRFYDRFRDRLIFPLKDSRGVTLGFSGRLIDDGQAKSAKYINSPETPIFNKGSLLFGLDVAKGAIREKNESVLVEGEFDVLSSYQAGIGNVVASKGTALTEKQVTLVSRMSDSVTICFDTDLAGDAAARRGIELLDLAGVSVKVCSFGKYKDPDEFSQKDPSGFKKTLKNAKNVYDYLIDSAISRYNSKSADGKKRVGAEILPVLGKISDDLVRAHYIEKLSKVLELDVSLVADAVSKKVPNVYISDPDQKTGKFANFNQEEYFLALILFQDEVDSQILESVYLDDFMQIRSREFWKWLCGTIKTSKFKNIKKLILRLPAKFKDFVDDLYLVNISPDLSDRELWASEVVKISKRIKEGSYRRQLAEISAKLKLAEKKDDNKEAMVLSRKFDQISVKLKEAI